MLGLLPKVVINNETTTDHFKFCVISVAESVWLHMEQQSTQLGSDAHPQASLTSPVFVFSFPVTDPAAARK